MIKTATTCIWGRVCEELGGTCISYGCNCEPGSCFPPGWCCAPSSNENCYCALPQPSQSPTQIPLFTIAVIAAVVGILIGIAIVTKT